MTVEGVKVYKKVETSVLYKATLTRCRLIQLNATKKQREKRNCINWKQVIYLHVCTPGKSGLSLVEGFFYTECIGSSDVLYTLYNISKSLVMWNHLQNKLVSYTCKRLTIWNNTNICSSVPQARQGKSQWTKKTPKHRLNEMRRKYQYEARQDEKRDRISRNMLVYEID